MGRNNYDFQGIEGKLHFSHKDNRKSIEKEGLRAGNPSGVDDFMLEEAGTTIDELHGVYAYRDIHEAHEDMVASGQAAKNQDIWEIRSDYRRGWMEDPLQGGAEYTPHDVYPYELRRVGHVTENHEVHWHPEEQCNASR